MLLSPVFVQPSLSVVANGGLKETRLLRTEHFKRTGSFSEKSDRLLLMTVIDCFILGFIIVSMEDNK